ncbi:MAG: Uma2 family endonuclease [Candidatus Poribacteria bacterium]
MSQTLQKAKRQTIEIARLFPLQGEWTESDYLDLPETNHYIELSEGRLEIPEMPGTTHQKVVFRLAKIIDGYVSEKALGEIGVAPLPVRLWEGKFREPDIIFMSSSHADRITESMWGIPDLVVEVISKSTAQTDRERKFLEYAKAGISEYWIVDPIRKIIDVYILNNGIYELSGRWGTDEIAKSAILSELDVDTNRIFI